MTHTPGLWSPKGDVFLFTASASTWDILALRLRDRKTEPFLQTRAGETAPQFSPDGHWVAYVSDEFGRQDVYVQPYPGPGGKRKISTDGGTEPIWNPNGRELFYRSGNKMLSANIITKPVFTAAKPIVLFTGDYTPTDTSVPNYDVARDGRFLMLQPSSKDRSAPTQIIVVLNWLEELKQRVPTH